jgi:hypothetical protein
MYDSGVFASDTTRLGRDPCEIASRTRKLLDGALRYAGKLGLRTCIGFEPYQVLDEILAGAASGSKARGSRTAVRYRIRDRM